MAAAPSLGHRRLAAHRVVGDRFADPADVVRHLGAMQAQAYHQAVWAVGVRLRTPTLAAVEQAVVDRRMVLTWAMRGTLHLVPAEDVGWMTDLFGRRLIASDQRRLRELGLGADDVAASRTALLDALADGPLPRSALMGRLAAAGIDPTGQRGYHLLFHAALSGLICFGPPAGKEQTLVRTDAWLPVQRALDREAAVAELARRYFTGHGPATVDDFAAWTGLPLRDLRPALAAVSTELKPLEHDGRELWLSPDTPAPSADAADVHLLPGFDEYLLGYRNRSDVLDPAHASRVVPGSNGMFKAMVVHDGRVVGTWERKVTHRVRTGSGVSVTVHPFPGHDVPDGLLGAAAERYAAFLGATLTSLR